VHVTLEWRDLPPTALGAWVPGAAGAATIVLATRLSRRQRRCVLAHELVHDERGITVPLAAPAALVAKEEAIVERITARRLVPPDELAAFVSSRAELEGITPGLVVEEFDVELDVARRALAELLGAPAPRRGEDHATSSSA
jgi:hypothetical protein